jgi:DNA-binding response OmpR family regulator/nitrogen-specific signal transduction histidine kinase
MINPEKTNQDGINPQPARRPLVLNVDDDDAGRYAVGRQLKQAGYDVIDSRTGEHALALAVERQPDLVLLDVRLPDIDGFEVCRRLRRNPQTSGIPIIQMSASYLDTSSRVKGLEIGADAYLTEPTEPAILVATLKSVLRMKHAEQTVRESASQWQSTFDAIQEGVAVLDCVGAPVRCNGAFERIAGPKGAGLGDTLAGGVAAVCSGGARFSVEQVSEGRTLSVTMDPIVEPGRPVTGAVCVVTDITEKKRFEEQLRQTAKLESIGVLAGGIAHDFNNLLTGILGNSSMIAESLPESSSEWEMAQEIVRASQSAADLTRQILAYSGRGRFVMKSVDLSELALESRSFVRRFIPRRLELVFDTAPDLPRIEADAGQMQQLLMNLIINAAESIGENDRGTVTVTTSAVLLDAGFFEGLEEKRPGDYVVLTVTDTGIGMDEATRARIFDPFFTTKFAGRGLGLSAVHGILQGHRGYLRLTSQLGEGSTFRLYFPVSKQAAPEKPLPERRPSAKGTGTILMVDDETTVRTFAKIALENRGYRVVLAENGEESVEIFRRRHDSIDLVILDFTMPVMNGEEAYEHLRAISPRIPVILSSGFSQVTAAERFRGKGLAGFLGKPYTIAQLAEAVESGLNRPVPAAIDT